MILRFRLTPFALLISLACAGMACGPHQGGVQCQTGAKGTTCVDENGYVRRGELDRQPESEPRESGPRRQITPR